MSGDVVDSTVKQVIYAVSQKYFNFSSPIAVQYVDQTTRLGKIQNYLRYSSPEDRKIAFGVLDYFLKNDLPLFKKIIDQLLNEEFPSSDESRDWISKPAFSLNSTAKLLIKFMETLDTDSREKCKAALPEILQARIQILIEQAQQQEAAAASAAASATAAAAQSTTAALEERAAAQPTTAVPAASTSGQSTTAVQTTAHPPTPTTPKQQESENEGRIMPRHTPGSSLGGSPAAQSPTTAATGTSAAPAVPKDGPQVPRQ